MTTCAMEDFAAMVELDGFLHRYFLNNGEHRLHKWVHYFDIYERHLSRFRGRAPVVLEIGVAGGGSLRMWHDYFGGGSLIIGLDINPKCKSAEADGIEVYIGSQSDPTVLDGILADHPSIDIVLDDGSHRMADLGTSFDLLYDRVDPRGVYIAEDLHTSYWTEYDGGLCRKGTFIELVKQKVDELHAFHARGAIPVSTFTRSTDSISVYDSVVVFERRPQAQRVAIITSPMAAAPGPSPSRSTIAKFKTKNWAMDRLGVRLTSDATPADSDT